MATDEILIVRKFSKDFDGTYIVRCPHCKNIVAVEAEDSADLKGEQYRHKPVCNGWFAVSDTAQFIREPGDEAELL